MRLVTHKLQQVSYTESVAC